MGRGIPDQPLVTVESHPRLGEWRRWHPTLLTALIALAAQACGSTTDGGNAGNASGGSSNGGTSDGGSFGSGVGGSGIINVGGSIGLGGACAVIDSPLQEQTVSQIGSQRLFYSWTTDDQVAELRAGGPLFSRSESPGKGRGVAMTQLAAYAAAGTLPEQTLAGQLASTVFAKLRFSWTNPWATLLGWPGETYGNQLLQVELKPEAWIAFFDAHGLSVYDNQSKLVDIQTALASPERIGAIYFQSSTDANSGYCGTFSQGGVAFREFVLGNIGMVRRWSLATPDIAQRLNDDITKLQAFEKYLDCLQVEAQATWTANLTCAWSEDNYRNGGALEDYGFALGIPSELYWPSPANIDALIAALQASMPTGDPLVVNPSG
jgi:hypothetical protein